MKKICGYILLVALFWLPAVLAVYEQIRLAWLNFYLIEQIKKEYRAWMRAVKAVHKLN